MLRWQCSRSGAGLWFRDYAEFEEELILLLDNEEVKARMGEQGRKFVQREYAWSAVEQRLLKAMDELQPLQ